MISPGALNVPVGGSSGAGVYEDLLDCYGNDAGLVARYATSWSIQYPSVTSVQTTGTGTMQANGLSDGTSAIDGYWDTSYYEADEFTHECYQYSTVADAPGNVTAQQPTSLRTTYDQYTQPPPSGQLYNRERHYQVLDQNGQPILQAGLSVTESWSTPQGTCTIQDVKPGNAQTNSNGEFKDNYYLTTDAPNPCSSSATQHHIVSG